MMPFLPGIRLRHCSRLQLWQQLYWTDDQKSHCPIFPTLLPPRACFTSVIEEDWPLCWEPWLGHLEHHDEFLSPWSSIMPRSFSLSLTADVYFSFSFERGARPELLLDLQRVITASCVMEHLSDPLGLRKSLHFNVSKGSQNLKDGLWDRFRIQEMWWMICEWGRQMESFLGFKGAGNYTQCEVEMTTAAFPFLYSNRSSFSNWIPEKGQRTTNNNHFSAFKAEKWEAQISECKMYKKILPVRKARANWRYY